jgi:hypothetical protein
MDSKFGNCLFSFIRFCARNILPKPTNSIDFADMRLRTNCCALSSARIPITRPYFFVRNAEDTEPRNSESSVFKNKSADEKTLSPIATKGATVGIQAHVDNCHITLGSHLSDVYCVPISVRGKQRFVEFFLVNLVNSVGILADATFCQKVATTKVAYHQVAYND